MPGFLVDISTTMTCPHGGTITFVPVGPPAVLLNGNAVITAADKIVVKTCTSTPKCAFVQWHHSGQVLVNGQRVLLQTTPIPPGPGDGICVGSGAPLLLAIQPFVTGG